MDSSPKLIRKNKIIQTALVIFAEKGFQEATVSEISKAAGVSEATVYEYFKTKEDLLFAIPEEITEEAFNEWGKVLPYLRGTEAKLRAIVQGYMTLYENNPPYTALVLIQIKVYKNFLKTRAYKIIQDVSRLLLGCIQEGIDNGSFKKDTNPFLVRSMILGTIENLCIRRHLLGKPSNLVEQVDPMVDVILSGIRAERKTGCPCPHINYLSECISSKDNTPAG